MMVVELEMRRAMTKISLQLLFLNKITGILCVRMKHLMRNCFVRGQRHQPSKRKVMVKKTEVGV